MDKYEVSKWERRREKGLERFVLHFALLGGFYGAAILAFRYFSEFGFTYREEFPAYFWGLKFTFLRSVVIGGLIGTLLWYITEFQYRRTVKKYGNSESMLGLDDQDKI